MEKDLKNKAVKLIQKKLGIRLPKDEASNIALHLINAQAAITISGDEILEMITEIIGSDFQLYIDKSSFNYSRFVTRLQYMLKRKETGEIFATENMKIYSSIKEQSLFVRKQV